MIEITLPAGLDSPLLWKEEELLAQQAKQAGKKILWKFDFGLDRSDISLDDPSHFLTLSLSLDHFVKTLAVAYGNETAGVVLYAGDIYFDERMLWSATLQDYYAEWLNEMGREESEFSRRLFCMNVFAEYLHRLASYLPDEMTSYCFFEVLKMKPAHAAQLFSKDRFGAIQLELGEKRREVGVVLPGDELCQGEIFEELNQILEDLERDGVAFKVIPEGLLTEEWQGIEKLYVLRKGITGPGSRMLKGFEASGGEVEWVK